MFSLLQGEFICPPPPQKKIFVAILNIFKNSILVHFSSFFTKLFAYVMPYLPLEDVWKLKHINDKLGEKLEQYKSDEEIFVEFLDQREQYNFGDFNTKISCCVFLMKMIIHIIMMLVLL